MDSFWHWQCQNDHLSQAVLILTEILRIFIYRIKNKLEEEAKKTNFCKNKMGTGLDLFQIMDFLEHNNFA